MCMLFYINMYANIADLVEVSITGAGEVSCGNTACFTANVKQSFESSNWSLTWQKSRGRISEQIDICSKKYMGSNGRQLVINSVGKKDEGAYQASYSNGKKCNLSNSIYLTPLGGTVLFMKKKINKKKSIFH